MIKSKQIQKLLTKIRDVSGFLPITHEFLLKQVKLCLWNTDGFYNIFFLQ